jgi:hypothetical protein
MMGQMSQVTPPMHSTMADLQSLLELISNPTEAKRLLEQLSTEAKTLSVMQEEASKSAQSLQAKLDDLEAREKTLASAQETLDVGVKKYTVDVGLLNASESELLKQANELKADFKKAMEKIDEADKLAIAKESAASAKMESALALEQEALAMKSEYEAKLAKLKSMIGG